MKKCGTLSDDPNHMTKCGSRSHEKSDEKCGS